MTKLIAVFLFSVVAGAEEVGPLHPGEPLPVKPKSSEATAPSRPDAKKTELNKKLLLAAREGKDSLVKELISQGADVNYVGAFENDTSATLYTPLVAAALANKPETMKLLLSKGANVNLRSKNKADGSSGVEVISATPLGFLLNHADPTAITPAELKVLVQILSDHGANVSELLYREFEGYRPRSDSTLRLAVGLSDFVAGYLQEREKLMKENPDEGPGHSKKFAGELKQWMNFADYFRGLHQKTEAKKQPSK